LGLNIEREIVIDAPVEVVWRTITEPDQIERWFAKHAELDCREGGDGVLVFESATASLVVERVDRPRLFAFRWGHPEGERPRHGNSMLVEFTLVAEGDEQTRLRVVETGIEATPRSDDEKEGYAEDHRRGWQINFDRIAALLHA
jgi:uncharacterized protein YndB with AHSA1/START domain